MSAGLLLQAPEGVGSSLELAGLVRSLSEISTNLLASYATLAERAGRVDSELAAANAQLARQVDELGALHAHLEAILHALPCGVVVRDRAGRIVRVNAAAAGILGVPAARLVAEGAHSALEGAHPDGAQREIVRADGERRVVVTRRSPLAGDTPGDAGSVEILDDRTEVARLAERLQAQGKMAALGTLAGGIAHEIRNPLNAIGGCARLLEREVAPETRHHRYAARIAEGVREADVIIANLLSFADPERLQLETIVADELARSALECGRAALPAGGDPAAWTLAARVSGPAFVADRIKLRQALRNLVANAIEAQPAGGRVDLAIDCDGREVVLAVRDGGPGVPAHLRQRIADPFFTTRAEGTGLGLALVHTIAALHGGSFEVSPERAPPDLGGGAQMILRIPFNPA